MPEITIPNYRIIREIGQGGMSVVYLAVQESLNRNVALKVMSPVLLAADQSFGDRFLKEGRTVAQLRHPGIVQVHDIGATDDSFFMAMEHLPGGDLAGRIRQGMGETEALNVLRQVAEALGYAHGKGFVHRDIKPENVLFDDDGRVVLTDFGIAKAMRSGTKMTRAGMSIGTPQYMSPEQARGKGPVDGRSDLYSLGVVFHEMLTGHVPYDAEDTLAIAYAHVNDPVPTLPTAHSKYQPLLDRLLAKNPEDRFADAGELLAALDTLAAGDVIAGPQPRKHVEPRPSRDVTEQRGGQGMRWALGGALLGLVVFGLAYLYLAKEPQIVIPAGPVAVVENQSTLPATPNTPAALNVPAEMPEEVEMGITRNTPGIEISDAQIVQTVARPADTLDNQPAVLSPEQARQAEIQELLNTAATDIQARRLTLPAGHNAFEKYQRVLKLDRGNANAHQGLKHIVQGYITLAEQAITSKRFSDASNHLNLADTVLPGENAVSALRERLVQAKQNHEEEQARLAEERFKPGVAAIDEERWNQGVHAQRFTDNGDGTVTDNVTKLLWTKNANLFGRLNWNDAMARCSSFSISGIRGCRLPSKDELVELSKAMQGGHPFTGVQSSYYWSSTYNADLAGFAWLVLMNLGSVLNDDKGSSGHVWPVCARQ